MGGRGGGYSGQPWTRRTVGPPRPLRPPSERRGARRASKRRLGLLPTAGRRSPPPEMDTQRAFHRTVLNVPGKVRRLPFPDLRTSCYSSSCPWDDAPAVCGWHLRSPRRRDAPLFWLLVFTPTRSPTAGAADAVRFSIRFRSVQSPPTPPPPLPFRAPPDFRAQAQTLRPHPRCGGHSPPLASPAPLPRLSPRSPPLPSQRRSVRSSIPTAGAISATTSWRPPPLRPSARRWSQTHTDGSRPAG